MATLKLHCKLRTDRVCIAVFEFLYDTVEYFVNICGSCCRNLIEES